MTRLIEAPSPNFNARLSPPDMVVLHYTGMETGEAALERMCDPDAKVSAHYMVEEGGRVYSLVPEERRAWHAGVSYWQGEDDVNGASIGIEIVNPGHEWGYRDFPSAQIDAVIGLLSEIRERWSVPDDRIVGHSDVAPDRKTDPGEKFPWARLAEAGHGLWVEASGAPGAELGPGDSGPGVAILRGGLARLGYQLEGGAEFDAPLQTVITAFQRHWAPHRLDGIADGATRATLMALLRKQLQG